MPVTTPTQRVDALDWNQIRSGLLERGTCQAGPLLNDAECRELISLYEHDPLFRKRIEMESHSYGRGEYAYFRNPLPVLVTELREALYRRLQPIANQMHQSIGIETLYPETLDAFLDHCHGRGQQRPTPLLLRYRAGGYNRMHRDLYGDVFFPFQATVFLSEPGKDFDGGEFLLQEQRPRVQPRVEVCRPARGDLILFASRECMTQGKRGPIRLQLRHGVATVQRGERYTLGIIFHDAE